MQNLCKHDRGAAFTQYYLNRQDRWGKDRGAKVTGTPGPQQHMLRRVRGRLSANPVQRRLYRYAVTLVLVFASLLAIVLLFLDRTTPLHDKFTQIGTGLAASIIFALIYTVLANREYAELIKSEIASQFGTHAAAVLHEMKQLNERFSAHAAGVLQEMQQLNKLFLPTGQYPPTEFDQDFNRDLTRDLCASTKYFFRGTSARYIPARLRHSDPNLRTVQVLLVDPRNEGAIDVRAQDRRRRPQYEGQDLADIKRDIRTEIQDSAIALFDCRDRWTIELGVTPGTSSLRTEIFDDALYLSLYRTPSTNRASHPATIRFSRFSQLYDVFQDEWHRQFEAAAARRSFTIRNHDEDLLQYLAELGYQHVGAGELVTARERNTNFLNQFVAKLGTIGAQT